MNDRLVVTLSMVGTGYLVVRHAGVPDRVRGYVGAVRSGQQPSGEDASIGGDAARWLIAWFLLFVLLLAAVEVGPGLSRLAALFSLAVAVSAAYRFFPKEG